MFQCLRKHLLKDKIYLLRLVGNRLSIGDWNNMGNPKYSLIIGYDSKLHWRCDNGVLIAFGLIYRDTLKWFHAGSQDLMNLKSSLACRMFFSNMTNMYECLNLLGEGSTCKVYSVKDKLSKRIMASKCIKKEYIFLRKDNERYNRLLQEIHLMCVMNHDGIVKLYDIYQGDKSIYLVMDYLKGQTIQQYVSDQAMSIQQIRIVMKYTLRALVYLESIGIIHRDIKLENLVLAEPNVMESVKLIDFGLAIHVTSDTKYLCGTPGYIAPELFQQGYPYDHKVDMFSLGVIFYKMLTRKSLFKGNTSEQILENNKAFNMVNQLKNVPQDAINLVNMMLMRDPRHRISASQALNHPFFKGDKPQSNLILFTQQDSVVAEEQPVSVHNIPVFMAFNSNDGMLTTIRAIRDYSGSSLDYTSKYTLNYFPSIVNNTDELQFISDHIIE